VKRGAHSLVELMLALAIGTMAVGAVYLARFGGGGSGTESGVDGGAMVDLQSRLRQLVVDIQDATRVFYPLAGEEAKDGLGLTSSKSETVLYHVEPVAGQSELRLMRVNLTESRKGVRTAGAFIERLHHVRFEVAPAEPGKRASLVRIDLAVQMPGQSPGQTVRVSYVSAAFPRNLERPVPDDLLVPGSPLARTW
jgi:hypothetical protein